MGVKGAHTGIGFIKFSFVCVYICFCNCCLCCTLVAVWFGLNPVLCTSQVKIIPKCPVMCQVEH